MTSTAAGRVTLGVALACVLGLASGCQTAVGNYFASRCRDFGECFRAQVGVGRGFGAGVKAGGLVAVGAFGGCLALAVQTRARRALSHPA